MRGEQGVGEARWSIFPDSPGCGEPCLKESVCIYYSKPLQSQGADFLLLFLPRPSAPCYRVGSVCRPGLSKGPGRAPTSQSDSCSVKCGGNRSHNCTAQKQKSGRCNGAPCLLCRKHRPLLLEEDGWVPPQAHGTLQKGSGGGYHHALRVVPGPPWWVVRITRSCHFLIKQPLPSPSRKRLWSQRNPSGCLPRPPCVQRANSQLGVFCLFVCWVEVLL